MSKVIMCLNAQYFFLANIKLTVVNETKHRTEQGAIYIPQNYVNDINQ